MEQELLRLEAEHRELLRPGTRLQAAVIALAPRTGEILALANFPTYDPNKRDVVPKDRARNRALTDVFEPGSTLKPFTIAAALDAGKVRPETVIQTGGGALTIGGRTIHDAHAPS